LGGRNKSGMHAKRSGKCPKTFSVGGRIVVGLLPLDALEKNPRLHVAMLIGVEDISTAFKNPPSHAGHEPRLIRAVEKCDKSGWNRHG
jgi:hypothetical protein